MKDPKKYTLGELEKITRDEYMLNPRYEDVLRLLEFIKQRDAQKRRVRAGLLS